MIGVESHRYSVSLRSRIDVVRPGNSAENRSELFILADTLSDEKLCSTIGKLDHHRRIDLSRGRQRSINCVRTDAVDCGKRKFVRLGIVKQLFYFIAEENSGSETFVVAHDSSKCVVVRYA